MQKNTPKSLVVNKKISDVFDALAEEEGRRRKVVFDDRLLVACANGDVKNVKNLLKHNNIDINQNISSFGGTALIRAVYHNYHDIAEHLLTNKADPNIMDASSPNNATALDYAWEMERNNLFALLLMYGGYPQKYAKFFETAGFVVEALALLSKKYCHQFPLCTENEIALFKDLLQKIEDNFTLLEIKYMKNSIKQKAFGILSHFNEIMRLFVAKLISIAKKNQRTLCLNALNQFLFTSQKQQKKLEKKIAQNKIFISYLQNLPKRLKLDEQILKSMKN